MLWIKKTIPLFLPLFFLNSRLPENIGREQNPVWTSMKAGDDPSIKTISWGCFLLNDLELKIHEDELGFVIQVSKTQDSSYTILKNKNFRVPIFNYLNNIGGVNCRFDGSGGYTIVRLNQYPPDTLFGCPRELFF